MLPKLDQESAIVYLKDKTFSTSLVTYLKGQGISAIHDVSSTDESIDALKSDSRAAIFLDWQGIDSIMILSASKGTKPVDPRPIVLLVSKEEEGLLEVMTDYHVNRILTGTVNTEDIPKIVTDLFKPDSPTNTLKRHYAPYLSALDKKQYSKAKEILEMMQGQHPNNHSISLELANLHIMIGEWDEAEDVVVLGLEQNNKLPRASHIKARCLLEKKEDNEAEKHLEDATNLNPLSIDRLIDFGDLLLDRGKYAKAKSVFQKASKISENDRAKKGEATSRFLLDEQDGALNLLQELPTERERAGVAKSPKEREREKERKKERERVAKPQREREREKERKKERKRTKKRDR